MAEDDDLRIRVRDLDDRVNDLERNMGVPGGAAEAVLLIREWLVELAQAVEASDGELTRGFDERMRRIEQIGNLMR
jgi:hypothetical protein